jgi:hypothetical protein
MKTFPVGTRVNTPDREYDNLPGGVIVEHEIRGTAAEAKVLAPNEVFVLWDDCDNPQLEITNKLHTEL